MTLTIETVRARGLYTSDSPHPNARGLALTPAAQAGIIVWIYDLRTTDALQAPDTLRGPIDGTDTAPIGYCCLGRAAVTLNGSPLFQEVHVEVVDYEDEGEINIRVETGDDMDYECSATGFPVYLQEVLGMPSELHSALQTFNDNRGYLGETYFSGGVAASRDHLNFEEISNLLERFYWGDPAQVDPEELPGLARMLTTSDGERHPEGPRYIDESAA